MEAVMRIRDVEGKIIKAGDEIYFVNDKKKIIHEVFNKKNKLVFAKKYQNVCDHSELSFVPSDDLKVFKIIDNK
jgi:signal peptidase I